MDPLDVFLLRAHAYSGDGRFQSLAFLCLAYLHDVDQNLATWKRISTCERYGREAGRRVVFHQIPHAGYWFE